MSKELRERQAKRITEIQNMKIALRKLANDVAGFRRGIAAGPSLPFLYSTVACIESAIERLDKIKREDL